MQYKFVLFCFVGFTGLIIDFGMTYLLKEKVNINKFIANGIGFITAVSSNFYLNKRITFNNTDPNFITQYMSFILVSLVGLSINTFLIYLFHTRLKYQFYLSKLFSICIVVVWNYFMSSLLVFS
jgi:putative flippase GtrA